ncbi:hypothetical protein NMY22_g20294 [Coprinellus aureogranulatus]|nr:hypothetical protein NMY22_g20294 [Coprinellus aureogranulatus]
MSQRERTYIMVKPDGVQRGLVGEIIARFEKRGFKLIALKLVHATPEHLEKRTSSPFLQVSTWTDRLSYRFPPASPRVSILHASLHLASPVDSTPTSYRSNRQTTPTLLARLSSLCPEILHIQRLSFCLNSLPTSYYWARLLRILTCVNLP